MKYSLSAAVALVLLAAGLVGRAVTSPAASRPSSLLASRPTADLQAHLEELEKQSWVAWKNRDGAFFEHFLSDDHVEMGPRGTAGKAAVVATVNTPNCVVASFSVDTFTLTQFTDDTAMLAYHARQDTKCSGKPVPSPAWVSSLYVKRNGRWLNALYQQTPAAE